MLHPVGDRPAGVYWRRRVVVLLVLLAVLGGVGWLALALLDRSTAGSAGPARSTTPSTTPAAAPALERVLPSLAGVRTPAPAPLTPAATTEPPASEAAAAGPGPGSACTDDMVDLAVRAPDRVDPGSKPTFELVVTNTADVPCERPLDKELLELVLLGPDGDRVWGSNDCFPEQSDDVRVLAPGEPVVLSLVWGGLTSEPECAGERVTVPPGDYVVSGRLGTDAATDAPLRVG